MPRFGAITARLWQLLREESLKIHDRPAGIGHDRRPGQAHDHDRRRRRPVR